MSVLPCSECGEPTCALDLTHAVGQLPPKIWLTVRGFLRGLGLRIELGDPLLGWAPDQAARVLAVRCPRCNASYVDEASHG